MAYVLADLGHAVVFSIDPQGRVTGATCAAAGPVAPCTGAIYTPRVGWSSVPIPAGASHADVIGIDENDTIGMNVFFPYAFPWPGNPHPTFLRAYTAYPLQPVDPRGHNDVGTTTDLYVQTTRLNAVEPSTGHMVGYDEALGGAFLFDGKAITPIAVQPGQTYSNSGPSQATALNARDQVVGWMRLLVDPYNGSPSHAFFWDHGTPIDLGTVGPCSSAATAINGAGIVVGFVDVAERCGHTEMFVWDGRMRVVGCPSGALSCSPNGINGRGDIVGNALTDELAGSRAFIFHDGAFQWLDDEHVEGAAGWSLEYAVGINERGDIAGWGTWNGEPGRAFLLTARSTSARQASANATKH